MTNTRMEGRTRGRSQRGALAGAGVSLCAGVSRAQSVADKQDARSSGTPAFDIVRNGGDGSSDDQFVRAGSVEDRYRRTLMLDAGGRQPLHERRERPKRHVDGRCCPRIS